MGVVVSDLERTHSYFIDSVVGEVRLWEVNDFRMCGSTSQQDPILWHRGELSQGVYDLYI